MFLGLLLKDGDNQRISVIWMTHQQPQLKKCTVDKAISFQGILDYTLKHFFHSKNKTRALILTSRTDLKFIIANPEIFDFSAHLGGCPDSDSLVPYPAT